MLRKAGRKSVRLIAFCFLFSVVATTSQAQNAASVHVFGVTISNIYDWGVMITDVDIGSRARQIGLMKDDVILAVNGEPVLGTYDFLKILWHVGPGPLTLTISRVGNIGTFVIDTR